VISRRWRGRRGNRQKTNNKTEGGDKRERREEVD
jgi:hypothetical protein